MPEQKELIILYYFLVTEIPDAVGDIIHQIILANRDEISLLLLKSILR